MSSVRRWVALAMLLACGVVAAQPTKPAEGVRASAVKMPDGTVVFITKNPGDADPKIDGVLMSAAEYQALLEQAEKVKKAKDGAKPQPPGKVELRARVEPRGDRTVAALTAVFTYRTVSPKTVVALGCQRAVAVGAKASDGKTPILTVGEDGFAVLAESAGDHTLTLELEAAVTARGPKGEFGFEFALPRAAITSFTLEKPPAEVKTVSVGTRSPEPFAGVKHTPAAVSTLTAAFPLGPTDTLELLWEPRTPADAAGLTAEGEVTVRVSDTQVETVAKLKLRGPAKEWPLILPPTAEVTVERIGKATSPLTAPAAVEKPADPQKPVWVIRTPPAAEGWLVTVAVRTLRPPVSDPKARGPYPIGPFTLPNVRHTGRVRVYAPSTLRLGFRPSADLRRQDVPAADDELMAAFQYSSSPAGGRPWGEFDVRPVANVPRVRPHHKLTLTPNGWRLDSTVRVTPPPRGELEQLAVELPAGWQGWEFGPDDQVESDAEAADPSGRRAVTLRFVTPQKAAVDLRVFATHPLPPAGRQTALPFPRFLQADERDTLVEVTGGDGWAVSATGYGWDRGSSAGVAQPLRGAGRDATGEFDRGVSRAEVAWRPFRPELACDIRADVTVQDRQVAVQQSLRFRLTDGDARPLRLTSPGELAGLRWTPRLEQAGPTEWLYRLPPDAGKEVTLVAQYAVKMPSGLADADQVTIPFIHSAAATAADSVVRVWGGGGRLAAGFVGDWRELAPELAPESDSLPWFTLGSSALAPPPLALTNWSAGAPVVVERGLVQATLGEDGGSRVRGRYLLRRWEGGHIDFDLPPAIAVEATVDGKRVDPAPLLGGARVAVPEFKPGRGLLAVEVRVHLPAANTRFAGRVLIPPTLRQASYRAAVRWQVTGGSADVLAATSGGNAEWRWGWKGYGFGPVAVDSAQDVENWFRSAAGADEPARVADSDTLLLRQPAPSPVRVLAVPRPVAVMAASALSFAIVYGIVRLAGRRTGMLVALLSAGVAVAVVCLPHTTAAAIAAAQPGVALAVAAVAARAVWVRYRRRARRPPTFSAAQPPPSTPSGNGVPRSNGVGGSSPSDAVRVIGS